MRSSTAEVVQDIVVARNGGKLPAPNNIIALNPPSSSPGGVKRLNLSGFAKKKESGKTEYPVFPQTEESGALVNEIRQLTDELEAIDGALFGKKKRLGEIVAPFHFSFAAGKQLDKSIGIICEGQAEIVGDTVNRLEGRTTPGKVRIDFKDSYPTLESDSMLIPILGQRVGECFEQSFVFKIEGDKLPQDRAADIVAELKELFARHNATDALTVKEGVKPVAGFHLKRHTMFTAEVNLQLNSVCPIRAAVATKNVK